MQSKAEISPSIIEIAWAAGIYEGEGNIDGASRTTQHVNVSQKERWILDKLQTFFGGKVILTRGNRTKYGKYHCWRWYATGPRARGFVLTLYPFLSPRRQQQIRKALKMEDEIIVPETPTTYAPLGCVEEERGVNFATGMRVPVASGPPACTTVSEGDC